ncbi:thioredoxin reductase [Virgibacillus dakarensis]|uniref:Ferredoxin--NADP reductase n=1 Tax=Lentibacillus populi TaxID=1827502 RepID=A0A9W5U165_9BACI|nr:MULTISPECIES: NAD(P)/FAD-dependent oxidoreductase [Bacillaceae]MBT2218493.1 NAD(P)/FAD-dependent oxidoreductase [Virgibacillus dakarensis]MTW86681.1 thioredoxin reductase [Virgibacillus dakarensis]GGB59147.1 ferredoxin--NADP reductase 1 [Lentibacillus populi]
MHRSNECFDITIVGGGPAGLFSAFYSGLREMKTKILEYQPHLGGKVHVYPEKIIWDVGGLTPAPASQLINQMIKQGLTFDPEVILGTKVTSISKNEDGLFVLDTNSGEKHLSKTVVLAVGGGILNPVKIPIVGAEKFELTNLHYTVKSLNRFCRKTIIISGGGNTAIDWANELAPIAEKVYLTYRKEKLKGHEAQISQLENNAVTCLLNTSITKLIPGQNHEQIEMVELTNKDNGMKHEIAIDEVVINHGYERDTDLLDNSPLSIKRKDNYFILGNAMSETSIDGLYAAGDILHHEGKLHLIAGAFQDAANAVNRAKQYIHSDAEQIAMVSSHNEIFKERNKKIVRELIK